MSCVLNMEFCLPCPVFRISCSCALCSNVSHVPNYLVFIYCLSFPLPFVMPSHMLVRFLALCYNQGWLNSPFSICFALSHVLSEFSIKSIFWVQVLSPDSCTGIHFLTSTLWNQLTCNHLNIPIHYCTNQCLWMNISWVLLWHVLQTQNIVSVIFF